MTILALLVALWLAHPGRVLDGDTFEVSAQVWIGQTVTTRIRVIGIDTPEYTRPRCPEEKALAVKARDFTVAWLARGDVYLSGIHEDTYSGRIDAVVQDASGASLAADLIAAGHAVPMGRTRTKDWCLPSE